MHMLLRIVHEEPNKESAEDYIAATHELNGFGEKKTLLEPCVSVCVCVCV